MSRATPEASCARTDAVLARFLDGDVGEDSGFELVCDETLRTHLRDCAICRRHLLRARRLDAALAAQAGAAVGAAVGPLAQRWFAVVAAGRGSAAGGIAAGNPVPAASVAAATAATTGAARPGVRAKAAATAAAAARSAGDLLWRQGSRRDLRPLLAAACTAVLCGVVVWSSVRGTPTAARTATPSATPSGSPSGSPSGTPMREPAGERTGEASPHAAVRAPGTQRLPEVLVRRADVAAGGLGREDHATATLAPQIEPPAAPSPRTGPATAHDGVIRLATDAARRQTQRPRTERLPTPDATALWHRVADTGRSLAEREVALAQLQSLPRHVAMVAAEPFVALAGLGDTTAGERALHARALAALRADPAVDTHLTVRLRRLASGGDDRGRGGHALADARSTGSVRDTLADLTLDDLARIAVAARLDSAAADAALLDLVRRRPACGELVAAALRCGVRDEGAAHLLLDAWCDLTARGILDAADTTPMAWFVLQPPPLFAAVAAELTTTRSAPRRVHCLLALGQATDAASLRHLLEHLVAAPFLEAHAAAFALSHRPRPQLAACLDALRSADPLTATRGYGGDRGGALADAVLQVLAPTNDEAQAGPHPTSTANLADLRTRAARDDGHLLLLAALARAGMADAAAWADPATLRALRDCPFAAFPRLAGRLRDRTLPFRE